MSTSNGHCAARAKSTGKPCRNPAGFGTDHLGVGRCKFHGGASPVRHGRYSAVQHRRLGDLIREHQEDPDPYNLEPELALLRALLEDYMERYDEYIEALIAWHESFGSGNSNPKPRQLLDVADAKNLVAEIGRLVERTQRMKAMNAIAVAEVVRVFAEIKSGVDKYVSDPRDRMKLADHIATIRPRTRSA